MIIFDWLYCIIGTLSYVFFCILQEYVHLSNFNKTDFFDSSRQVMTEKRKKNAAKQPCKERLKHSIIFCKLGGSGYVAEK